MNWSKFRKKIALSLSAVMMVTSLAACNAGGSGADKDKLVIWTLAEDLKDFGKRYQEETGTEVETIVIEPANYPTKVQTAIQGKQTEPDIIVAEPQMLGNFYDAGYFADLDELGAKEHEGEIVDYVWEAGKDKEGIQRAISYQITPAGFFYRRDIANEVFGTEDPAEISKLFKDYETILDTAQKLKEHGYRIFASDGELFHFQTDEPWVKDGKLNVSDGRLAYKQLVNDLYNQDLTAYAAQWSTPWYQGMAGEIPILKAEDDVNVWDESEFEEGTEGRELTEIFAYGLPSWGVLIMRDNVNETAGKWGVAEGPNPGYGGGTYIGISNLSERKEKAWDFVKWATLNEETSEWWLDYSEGDTVSLESVLEKHKDDKNEVYGGQKLYSFWLDQAKNIDLGKVTQYDQAINDAFGAALSAIKTGEKTEEEAMAEFYDSVKSTFPELEVEEK